eukprot:4697667-Amphidinium_carterae.1
MVQSFDTSFDGAQAKTRRSPIRPIVGPIRPMGRSPVQVAERNRILTSKAAACIFPTGDPATCQQQYGPPTWNINCTKHARCGLSIH